MKEIQNAAPIKQSGMGKAFPLGATITQEGCNFAVYAPDAKAVVLCFFNSDTEEALDEFPLPEKTGDVWHGLFTGVSAGQYYGYRVERNEAGLHSVPTDKLLIDPYAKKISRAIKWDARRYKHDSQFMIPKCIVIDEDRALITSANFTEAAHERNIEAGTVITDTILARSLRGQFDTLVDHGALKRVPGLGR